MPNLTRIVDLNDISRVDEMRYQMARQGWNNAPQCLLTPEQVQEFVPIMNIDKVILLHSY